MIIDEIKHNFNAQLSRKSREQLNLDNKQRQDQAEAEYKQFENAYKKIPVFCAISH